MLHITGEFFHLGKCYRLVVDKVVLCTAETPMAAFACLFGAFFAFNISYPADAGATLEYVQRLVSN